MPLLVAWAKAADKHIRRVPWEQPKSFWVPIHDIRRLDPAIIRPAIELLIQRLTNTPENVQSMLATTLGKLGDRVPLEPLLDMSHDPLPRTRLGAVLALTQLGWRAPVTIFITRLDDPEAPIRAQAAIPLGAFDDEFATKRLAAQAIDDPDLQARHMAATALCAQAERSFAPALAALQRVLSTFSMSIKYTIDKAVERLCASSRSEVRAVALALAKEAPPNLRGAALQGLAKGPDAPIALMIEALNNREVQTRIGAAKALGYVAKHNPVYRPGALEALVAALSDPDNQFVNAIIDTIGALGALPLRE